MSCQGWKGWTSSVWQTMTWNHIMSAPSDCSADIWPICNLVFQPFTCRRQKQCESAVKIGKLIYHTSLKEIHRQAPSGTEQSRASLCMYTCCWRWLLFRLKYKSLFLSLILHIYGFVCFSVFWRQARRPNSLLTICLYFPPCCLSYCNLSLEIILVGIHVLPIEKQ